MAGGLPSIPSLNLPGDWIHDAACAGLDPEAWWPVNDDNPTSHARRVCADCPVRLDCLRHAIDNGEQHGYWGGHTPDERRAIAAELAARRTAAGQRTCPGCYRRFQPRKDMQRHCSKACAGRANAEIGRQLRADREQVAA